jgi:hypothetical protein
MYKFRFHLVFLFSLVLLFAYTGSVLAQDVPVEQPPFTAPDIGDVTQAAFLALLAALSTAIASPLTAVLVSILKRVPLPFVQKLTGDQANLIVAVILSVLTWGASLLGLTDHLNTIFKLLYAVLPIISGAAGNYLANKAMYQKVYKPAAVPIAGHSKSQAALKRFKARFANDRT